VQRGGALVAGDVVRHGEQVHRFRDTVGITEALEDRERLLVVRQPRPRLLDVHVPVADAIEAPCHQGVVTDRAGHVERVAPVFAGPNVVARRPQLAECMKRFPRGALVGCGARQLERSGEVRERAVEFGEGLVGASAREMEADSHLHPSALGGVEGAIEVSDGLPRRRERHRVLRRTDGIARRGDPISGLPRMVGERLDDRIDRLGARPLEGGGDLAVQRDPFACQEIDVDGLASERVAEGESIGGFLDDELRDSRAALLRPPAEDDRQHGKRTRLNYNHG
jgi:hypothetical protein